MVLTMKMQTDIAKQVRKLLDSTSDVVDVDWLCRGITEKSQFHDRQGKGDEIWNRTNANRSLPCRWRWDKMR